MYYLLSIINCKVIICTHGYFHPNMEVSVSESLPLAGRRKSKVEFLKKKKKSKVLPRHLQGPSRGANWQGGWLEGLQAA